MLKLFAMTALSVTATSTVVAAASHNTDAFGTGARVTSTASPGGGWTGFYAGGQAGALDSEYLFTLGEYLTVEELAALLDVSESDVEAISEEEITLGLDGNFYGLHAGYMHQTGSLVFGVEVDYDTINFGDASVAVSDFKISADADLLALDGELNGNVSRLKLRAGYDAGQVMPYFTAGMAKLEVESDDTNGTFVGAGLAYKATENVLLGGEILRHSFDDAFDIDGFDVTATTASIRASYRF